VFPLALWSSYRVFHIAAINTNVSSAVTSHCGVQTTTEKLGQSDTNVFMCYRSHAVTQLVEALLCKPEGRRFDSPIVSLAVFGSTMALGSTQPPTEMSTSSISWRGRRSMLRADKPLSCTDCLEIWEPQPPVTLRVCNRLVQLYL